MALTLNEWIVVEYSPLNPWGNPFISQSDTLPFHRYQGTFHELLDDTLLLLGKEQLNLREAVTLNLNAARIVRGAITVLDAWESGRRMDIFSINLCRRRTMQRGCVNFMRDYILQKKSLSE